MQSSLHETRQRYKIARLMGLSPAHARLYAAKGESLQTIKIIER